MNTKPIRVPRKLQWALYLIPLLAALGGALAAIDGRYLTRDDFTLVHQRDSLTTVNRLQRIDDNVDILVRVCKKRGECP